jgi:hypothetical protein
MLSNINTSSMLGKMFIINLNWLQLLCGTSTPILEDDNTFEYIDNNWFLQLQTFLHEIKGKIKIINSWTPKKKRINDYLLMDRVCKLNISTASVKKFNNWRLYFQVQTGSDIIDYLGKNIQKQFITRKDAKYYKRTAKRNWPKQEMPHIRYFSTWLNILTIICKQDFDNKTNKMGTWVVNPNLYRKYKVLINKNLLNLIVWSESEWWEMEKSHTV